MDKKITQEIRKSVLHMMHYSKSSHIGSCLSIVDILYTLYYKILNIDAFNPKKVDRDKFILSKAHASAALYATLAKKEFFPVEWLDQYYINNGKLPGHLDMTNIPGIEISAGSLGHGLSLGLGMALANKYDNNPGKIFVLVGDGECNEGSVWEAAMLAGALEIDNITVLIDYNKIQSYGYDVLKLTNLEKRFDLMGFDSYEVDGHDIDQLEKVLLKKHNKPKAIVCNTIKGKGISFMENKLEWHYKSPNDELYNQAIKELEIQG